MELSELLSRRHSERRISRTSIKRAPLEFVLWAAQGAVEGGARRTCPSAGGRYPLELRVFAFRIAGLPRGIYEYSPLERKLIVPESSGQERRTIPGRAALVRVLLGDQDWAMNAAAIVLISGIESRLEEQFKSQPPAGRWERYLWIECGAAAQNAALAAEASGIGMTMVGGFDDEAIATIAGIDARKNRPLCLLTLGNPLR
ncbi:MAG: SagB/ThcOx family dehydrogenase [Gammaproteobacteria bacterium]|nr:SagB/ThcOx family dehydrogenase [Gammaproteobacteria bacterium]